MAEIENPFDKPAKELSALERANHLNQMYGQYPIGAGFYMKAHNGAEPGKKIKKSAVMNMGSYVNPQLAGHSTYFAALDSMMQCVQNNVHLTEEADQEKACAAEWKNLRLAAFNHKLTYQEVNRRWFMGELEHKMNYSGY